MPRTRSAQERPAKVGDRQGRRAESTFEIWLERLDPVAIGLRGELVLAAPATTRSWVSTRFAEALERAGRAVECTWRLADERELQLIDALALRTASPLHDQTTHSRTEAV